jgi:hypothetical protein
MGFKVLMPTTHDDITLGQVMRYNFYPMNNTQIVKNFCTGNVNDLTLDECDLIADALLELLAESPVQFKPFITIDGIEYGFIPDMNAISTGEYIDLETFCATPSETAHKAMAVLYRPITIKVGKRYEIEKYSTKHQLYADEFKNVPYSVFTGASAFFLTLTTESENNLSRFSVAQWKKLKRQGVIQDLMNLLEVNGDGTIPS